MTDAHHQALETLRTEREVRIVTRDEAGAAHRTIIWVVVDEHDRVLVRSYRGASARWFREAISGRQVEIEVAGRVLRVTVEPATDDERVEACSRLLESKYAGDPATPAMVRDEVLDTTLELSLAD